MYILLVDAGDSMEELVGIVWEGVYEYLCDYEATPCINHEDSSYPPVLFTRVIMLLAFLHRSVSWLAFRFFNQACMRSIKSCFLPVLCNRAPHSVLRPVMTFLTKSNLYHLTCCRAPCDEASQLYV